MHISYIYLWINLIASHTMCNIVNLHIRSSKFIHGDYTTSKFESCDWSLNSNLRFFSNIPNHITFYPYQDFSTHSSHCGGDWGWGGGGVSDTIMYPDWTNVNIEETLVESPHFWTGKILESVRTKHFKKKCSKEALCLKARKIEL